MKRTTLLLALSLATVNLSAFAADVYLGRASALIWGGSGANRLAQFAQAWTPASLSPVAWYKADGNATDARGNYNGTWAGTATYTNGLNGQAFAMTAQDRRISSAAAGALNLTNGTICFWVRPNWIKTDGIDHFFYDTFGGANGRFVGYKTITSFTDFVKGNKDITYTAGQWIHFAFTWNENKLYTNGVLASDFANSSFTATATTLYIGHRYTGVTFSAMASIDDFMLFNYSLKAAQIAQIYGWRQ
jgi:hypothetical protein